MEIPMYLPFLNHKNYRVLMRLSEIFPYGI